MKLINSIRTKIVLMSLIVLTVLVLGNIILFEMYVREYRVQKKMPEVYLKSIEYLNQLEYYNQRSLSLTKSWVFTDKDSSVQKAELLKILNQDYIKLKDDIKWYVQQWNKEEQNSYYSLTFSMDSLRSEQILITDKLMGFDDYNQSLGMYELYYLLSENGKLVRLSNRISKRINGIKEDIFKDITDLNNVAIEKYKFIKTYMFYFLLLLFVFLAIFMIFTLALIIYLQNKLLPIIKNLSIGIPVDIKQSKRKDEFGILHNFLYDFIQYLKSTTIFANKIGNNEFDYDFKPLSDKDVMGNSLIKMRDNMLKAQKEESLRQKENAQRNWSSQGIALFNEVIRTKNEDLKMLSDSVIKELVNYTDSVIGGLYIINEVEDEINIDLQSFYAFDRHKFMENRLKPGETLVGQCYLENSTIYINDVPDDYIYITSGLGKDKPKSILIVPLQFNLKTYGIVELASFEELPKYKIEFVERISETIASAISTAKVNERTAQLLLESNRKTELLQEQEKNSRKNIEKIQKELEKLQKQYDDALNEKETLLDDKIEIQTKFDDLKEKLEEEIKKESQKYIVLQNSINTFIPYYEMTSNGDITYLNDLYANLLQLSIEDVLNNKHINLVSKDFVNTGNYKNIWDKLKQNQTVDTSIQYTIEGQNKFLNEKLVPEIDKDGNLLKVRVFIF